MNRYANGLRATVWITAWAVCGNAAWADSLPEKVNFNRDIRPLLSNTCFTCHGPDEKERQAELRLDLKDDAFADRGDYFIIVPGKPDESELYRRISSHDVDEKMPPAEIERQLTAHDVELIRRWIEQGAEWQGHWSFIAPQRPQLPPVSDSDWPNNAIDSFVQSRLDHENLTPSPEADKTTLIRRVTFDLTGLPPTISEVDAFLADTSPDAYETVIDRLLKSPKYGEHMSRYWLDAARYGDTHGLHLDNERSLWPYRDWVISAFNSNMPFDQFTVEQLAGDLLPNPTRDQKVATGFNRCNVTTSEGGSIKEEYLVRYAVDRVETTSTVWMGITIGCAVCHDHKFDPISQKEFYQLFAYFNSLTEKAMDGNILLPPPILKLPTPEQAARTKELESEIASQIAEVNYVEPGNETDGPAATGAAPVAGENSESTTEVASEETEGFRSLIEWEQSLSGLKKKDKEAIPKAVREAVAVENSERTDEQHKTVLDYFLEHAYSATRSAIAPIHKQIAARYEEIAKIDKDVTATMIMEDMPERRDAFVLIRGQYDQHGDPVEAGVPASLPPIPEDAAPNRLTLAQWLVDPAHPLTARVTVNRFWQQYFGTGIVKTAEDFGSQGEWPSHPQLLDWLAVDFVESGWDVKRLQKQIVMSATYRQSSHVSQELVERDSENRLLARGPRFRFEAETIRDNALSLSGLLNDKIGGRSVKPYQPIGLWKEVGYTSSDTANFVADEGDSLYRRSMYTFWKRTSPPPSMLMFDAPSRESCTVTRARTNTPLQALVLMNDEQFVEAARKFAERIMREGGTTIDEQMTFAFRLATARTPNSRELSVLRKTYDAHRAVFQNDVEGAKKLLAVGASPRDQSLDVGDLAAWTMVGSLIMNLDETVTKG